MIASQIAQAKRPRDIAAVKTLFQEYAQSLNFASCFQDFDNEREFFSGARALTSGVLLLAQVALEPVGTVGLRPLDGESVTCEMKRLYAKPKQRRPTVTVCNEAPARNYRVMRLNRIAMMTKARWATKCLVSKSARIRGFYRR